MPRIHYKPLLNKDDLKLSDETTITCILIIDFLFTNVLALIIVHKRPNDFTELIDLCISYVYLSVEISKSNAVQ